MHQIYYNSQTPFHRVATWWVGANIPREVKWATSGLVHKSPHACFSIVFPPFFWKLILVLKRATRWKQSESLKMITRREAALLIWMFNQDGYISEKHTSNVLAHSIFGYFITIQCNVSLRNIYAKVCAKNSWKHKHAQVNSTLESFSTFMVLVWGCSLKNGNICIN